MSKWAIPTIAGINLDLAGSPEIGVEKRVFLSYGRTYRVAGIEMDDVASGTFIADRTYQPPSSPAQGYDMQVICDGPVGSAMSIVLTLAVTLAVGPATAITGVSVANPTHITAVGHGLDDGDTVIIAGNTGSTPTINGARVVTVIDDDHFTIPVNVSVAGTGGTVQETAAGQAVATFVAPQVADDQSFNFPGGLAVDLKPSAPDTDATVRTIDSIVSIAGGSAGAKFRVLAIPDRATFTEIIAVNDVAPELKGPKAVAIPNRYDSTYWVKRGRDEVAKLDVKTKWRGFGDGLPRANGQVVTLMMEVWKEDTVLSDRLFFCNWRPTVKKNSPDGDGEAVADGTGSYEILAAFA